MTLLAWLHGRLGYDDTRALLADLDQVDEGFDAGGQSHAFARIASRANRFDGITTEDLARYDGNIRRALAGMNAGRPTPITLRYFQYLAALYAEVFLDHRFNRPDAMLSSLNDFILERNIGRSPSDPRFEPFLESDLDKLAVWMATGSGKTLLLHLNYRQFLHYKTGPLDNIVLITPNEGLSEQHLTEMVGSNIPCRRFELDGNPAIDRHTVNVTEITKLVLEKRGEGQSVPVESFEGDNLIFVDEGHKGSGGDAWRQVRDAIGATGFTFEYSATFGQALTAARNDALTAEYGKAIAFDYSYRHFYNDGHGKDFNIVNLLQDPGEHTDVLLLANLLSLYEQHVVFRENVDVVRRYNLEQPLWALVGASVNAVYSEEKRKRSDVLTAIRFLHRFLSDRVWAVTAIDRLLVGESGLVGTQGDLFSGKFDYLSDRDAGSIYADILKNTFHARSAGGLHLCDIAGAEGELGLKVSGAEKYFGLIYIGDTAAFKKLVEADDAGITIEGDAISASLFDGINRAGTTIEILIGARKFLEGWNSWRVSNMGLLNIGRSEGAQIIQMFGRGVRLRGLDISLKRSAALSGSHPAYLKTLETLNVFALRANYMARFREYLEREGVVTEEPLQLELPIRPNDRWIEEDLFVPRLDEGRDFQNEVEAVLAPVAGTRVTLDLAGRAQAITSGDVLETMEASSGTEGQIPTAALHLVDWNAAYLDVVNHVIGRSFGNLAVSPRSLREIIENPATYVLVADERLSSPATLTDMNDLQEAVVAILRRYADRLYGGRRRHWESTHMHYRRVDHDDANLRFNMEAGDAAAKYIVSAPVSQAQLIEDVIGLADTDALYDEESDELPRIHFDRHLYQPLLIEAAGISSDIKTIPPRLNTSERRFVEDLRAYWVDAQKSGQDDRIEIFLLRNLSRGMGVGFFEERGFYPDFILWIKDGTAQRIVFIEPHGMMHAPAYAKDEKAQLHEKLPEIAEAMVLPPQVSHIDLDSFIVSATPYEELSVRYGDGSWTREQFAEKHILFQEDGAASGYDYIAAILGC